MVKAKLVLVTDVEEGSAIEVMGFKGAWGCLSTTEKSTSI